MEVGTLQEVCNNLPAEFTSPENGWRSNHPLIRSLLQQCKKTTLQQVGWRGGLRFEGSQ